MKIFKPYFAKARCFFLFSLTLTTFLTLQSCKKESLSAHQLAEIFTMEAFDLSSHSFTTGGVIINDGHYEITSKGICWDTLPNPTTEKNKLEIQNNDKSFVSKLTGLNDGTRYYVRAYLTNALETTYGNEIQVSTIKSIVYKGDLIIESQEELDLIFKQDISKINGNIALMYSANAESNILSLEAMRSLAEVTGNFIIGNSGRLENFQGLNQLEKIGGDFIIFSNDELIDFSGLSSLKHIEKSLIVRKNDKLSSLEGLHNIESIGRDLNLFYNKKIVTLAGLPDTFSISGSIMINSNPSLTHLEGLDGIKVIGNTLALTNNSQLNSLKGLDSIHTIGGSLQIDNNDNLHSLKGLDQLESIGKDIFSK